MSFEFKAIDVPQGEVLYYSSAKFREKQIDDIMHGRPVTPFPTERNFFLAKYPVALIYSNTVDYVEQYYHHIDIEDFSYMKRNFNVMHVYQTCRNLKLFDIDNVQNVERLLYGDPDSPFHYTKASKSVHRDDSIQYRINEAQFRAGTTEILSKYGLELDKVKYSGFAMLLAATGYHNYKTTGKLLRYSAISFDYILVQLLSDYLTQSCKHGHGHGHGQTCIDGWYQAPSEDFHEEFLIFDPVQTLTPLPNHKLSWTADIPTLRLRTKYDFDIIDGWIEYKSKSIREDIAKYQQDLAEASAGKKACIDQLCKGLADKAIGEITRSLSAEQKKLEDISVEAKNISSKTLAIYLAEQFPKLPSRSREYRLTQKFINRRTTSCRYESCKDPTSFEGCQNDLEKLVKEMRLYPNANNDHHVGVTVADHSIWVTRCIYQWLRYANHPWTKDIHPELYNITLLSAFLHDIGKIGDNDYETLLKDGEKRDHPTRGYMYLKDQLDFRGKIAESVDVYGCNPGIDGESIIAIVVLLHHHLGELLMTVDKYRPKDMGQDVSSAKLPHLIQYNTYPRLYLESLSVDENDITRFSEIIANMREFKYIIFCYDFLRHLKKEHESKIYGNKSYTKQVLLILLAVSAADVYGAYPVEKPEDSLYEEGLAHLLDPQVIYLKTQTHPDLSVRDIMRPYYKYLYYTFGIVERDNLIAYFDTIEDPDNFVEAWDNFQVLGKIMDGKSQRPMPRIFHYLDITDNDTWMTSLMQLLKSGILPFKDSQRPAKRIIEYFQEKPTKADRGPKGIVGKFKTHIHPGLSKQASELGIIPLGASLTKQAPF